MITQRSVVYLLEGNGSIHRALVELTQDSHVEVLSVANVMELVTLYDPVRPSCLILNVEVSVGRDLGQLTALRNQGVVIPVLVMTECADIPMAVQAMKNGASDFIEKPFDPVELGLLINRSLAQDEITRQRYVDYNGWRQQLNRLLPDETRVMDLLLSGRVVTEIAELLALDARLVEEHQRHVMQKLAVKSLADLVAKVVSFENDRDFPNLNPPFPDQILKCS